MDRTTHPALRKADSTGLVKQLNQYRVHALNKSTLIPFMHGKWLNLTGNNDTRDINTLQSEI